MLQHHTAGSILHSSNVDNQLILDKFLALINKILSELKLQQVDTTIGSIVGEKDKLPDNSLIDSILNSYQLQQNGKNVDIYEYIEEEFKNLTLNEIFTILSHIDVSAVELSHKEVLQMLSSAMFFMIKDTLLGKTKTSNS